MVGRESQGMQGKAKDVVKQLLSYPSAQENSGKSNPDTGKAGCYLGTRCPQASPSFKAVFFLPVIGGVVHWVFICAAQEGHRLLARGSSLWPPTTASALGCKTSPWSSGLDRTLGWDSWREAHSQCSTSLPGVQSSGAGAEGAHWGFPAVPSCA